MRNLRQIFLERFINLYPPFLGAGIRSRRIDDLTTRVELKLNAFNSNAVGAHYGGSLYSMCDPWYMLILIRVLGRDYIVWDKAATIQFLQPGRGTVTATFNIPQSRISEIRPAADAGQKIEPTFDVDIFNSNGQVVAHVEKLLYVRKR